VKRGWVRSLGRARCASRTSVGYAAPLYSELQPRLAGAETLATPLPFTSIRAGSAARGVGFRAGAGAPRWGGLDAQSRRADAALDSGSVRMQWTAPSTTRDQHRFLSSCPFSKATDCVASGEFSLASGTRRRGRAPNVMPTHWGVDGRGVGNRGCRASSHWPRCGRDAIGAFAGCAGVHPRRRGAAAAACASGARSLASRTAEERARSRVRTRSIQSVGLIGLNPHSGIRANRHGGPSRDWARWADGRARCRTGDVARDLRWVRVRGSVERDGGARVDLLEGRGLSDGAALPFR